MRLIGASLLGQNEEWQRNGVTRSLKACRRSATMH